ncbi:hypothetical protein [Mycolicibacterium setense]
MSSRGAPVAVGLPLGRPDNRRYTYRGDRRELCDDPDLMGPDAHGVYWRPVRAYYDCEAGSTLVVYEPVHPEEVSL